MDVIYRTKRVKEEIKRIMPTVLETKATFIFISANTKGTEQYWAIPVPSTLLNKKKLYPTPGLVSIYFHQNTQLQALLFESDFSVHAHIQSPKYYISGDDFTPNLLQMNQNNFTVEDDVPVMLLL